MITETQYVAATVISALGAIAFFMIRSWAHNWETKLTAHDDRLGKHDVQLATISANMKHIRISVDETRDDVKELLKNANTNGVRNGSRSTGGGQ